MPHEIKIKEYDVVSEIQLPMEYVNEILKFLTCYMRGNL
jgi:hypothetical protein